MTTAPILNNQNVEDIEDEDLDKVSFHSSLAFESLLRALQSNNWSDRNLAAKRLGTVSFRRRESVDALLCLLERESKPQVRKNAVKALGMLGDSRAITVLQRIRNNISKEQYSVRTAADVALQKIVAKNDIWANKANSLGNDSTVDAQADGIPFCQSKFPNLNLNTLPVSQPQHNCVSSALQQEDDVPPSRGQKRKCEIVFEPSPKSLQTITNESSQTTPRSLNTSENTFLGDTSQILFSSPQSSPLQSSATDDPNNIIHDSFTDCKYMQSKLSSKSENNPESKSNDVQTSENYKRLRTYFTQALAQSPKNSSPSPQKASDETEPNGANDASNSAITSPQKYSLHITPLQEAILRTVHDFPNISVNSLIAFLCGDQNLLKKEQNFSRFKIHPLFGNFKKEKEQIIKVRLGQLLQHRCVAKIEGKLSLMEHPIVQQILSKYFAKKNTNHNVCEHLNGCSENVNTKNIKVGPPSASLQKEFIGALETNVNSLANSDMTIKIKRNPPHSITPPNCDKPSAYAKTFDGIKPLKPFNRLLSSEPNVSPCLIRSRPFSGDNMSSQKSMSVSSFKNPHFEVSKTALAYLRSQASNKPINSSETWHILPQPFSERVEKNEVPTFKIPENLDPEQLDILHKVLAGESLFFTGAAGTGKSYLLKEIVDVLRQKHGCESVAVTAPTGIAACNIGGCTIHSFAGIRLGKESKEDLLRQVRSKSSNVKRWQAANVLVVDEVSMLSGDLFDKLNYIAQKIRKNEQPFGGIQVILCGDFFQLPPVSENNNIRYCFEATSWQSVIGNRCYELKQIYRQKDPEFIQILNEVRKGEISQTSLDRLNSCKFNRFDNSKIEPTKLCTHKKDVQNENDKRLGELKGDFFTYKAIDNARGSNEFLSILQTGCPAPTLLRLKVDAQVVLVKNLNAAQGLVNGTRGIVIGFEKDPYNPNDDTEYPRVQFSKKTKLITREKWTVTTAGKEMATREQIPLQLAWALSIHKSQGMTIDYVEMDLSNVFEYGQTYVALSRVTSLDGLKLVTDIPREAIRAHPAVLKFYHNMNSI